MKMAQSHYLIVGVVNTFTYPSFISKSCKLIHLLIQVLLVKVVNSAKNYALNYTCVLLNNTCLFLSNTCLSLCFCIGDTLHTWYFAYMIPCLSNTCLSLCFCIGDTLHTWYFAYMIPCLSNTLPS